MAPPSLFALRPRLAGRGQPPRRSSTEASDASLFLETEPGRGTLSNARHPKAFGTTPADNRNVALMVKFPNRRRALTVLCGLELVAGNLDCAALRAEKCSQRHGQRRQSAQCSPRHEPPLSFKNIRILHQAEEVGFLPIGTSSDGASVGFTRVNCCGPACALKARGAAPASVLTIVVLAGQFHASAAAAEIPVSIFPGVLPRWVLVSQRCCGGVGPRSILMI